MSSVAIVSVVWFTSTSWRRDRVSAPYTTGRARGFAFVEMSSDDEAQKAIAELNEYQLGGRSLSVNEARPKPAYAGGFGGGESRRRSEPRW